MFCEKCGAKLGDNDQFCSECGNPVTGFQKKTPVKMKAAKTGNASGGIKPGKVTQKLRTVFKGGKKPGKLLWVAVAAVIILVVFSPVRNFLMCRLASPKTYFQYVEKREWKKASKLQANVYANAKDQICDVKDKSIDAQIELELGSTALDLLEDVAPFSVDWMEHMGLGVNAAIKDHLIRGEAVWSLDEETVLSANATADLDGSSFYLQIPELNKEYLEIPGTVLENEYWGLGNDLEDLAEALDQADELGGVLPKRRVMEKLLSRYSDIVLSNITDVRKKSGKLRVEGISKEYTVLTAVIDSDAAYEIAKDVLDELREDKDVKRIIKDLAKTEMMNGLGMDPDDAYEEFQNALSYAASNLRSSFDSDGEIRMNIYVDGWGKVRGREILYPEDDMEFAWYMPVKGTKFACQLSVKEYGQTMFDLSGSGKRGLTKLNGTFEASVDGDQVAEVEISDLSLSKLKKGHISGTIVVAPSFPSSYSSYDSLAFIMKNSEFQLDIETGKKNSEYRLSMLNPSGDKELWSLRMSLENGDGKNAVRPRRNITEVEQWGDVYDWLQEMGGDALQRVIDAGVSSDVLQELWDILY